MNPTVICVALLIVMFTILLLRKMRQMKPEIAQYGTQRMCPFCGVDHISTKGILLGVRQVFDSDGVFSIVEK